MVGPFSDVDFARPEDEDGIYELLMKLHTENGIFHVDETRVRQFIKLGTEQKLGMIGVIRGNGGIEASVGMTMDQWWYTLDWCLSERWNFVLPEHRKSTHAVRLIEFAKWCSDQLKVPLQMGIITTQQTEAKVRMYRRYLTPVGGLFMHNLPATMITTAPEEFVVPSDNVRRVGGGDAAAGIRTLDNVVKRRTSVPPVPLRS